jgi:cytochrome d ubiquinol oxidase subunit I
MVLLGGLFLIIFILSTIYSFKDKLEKKRWFLYVALWSIPLVYIAGMAGWMLAEMGRQPWVIQDLMPTIVAVTKIESTSVITTFWLFALTFTILAIAEVRIMTSQIKKGPKDGGQ